MMQLYLARHGQTACNRTKVYYGKTDVPLDQTGYAQCADLAAKLANIRFEAVYASDLIRTVDTATLVLKRNKAWSLQGKMQRQLDINRCPAFSELDFGKWEGMNYTEVEKKYPQEWKAWTDDWMNYKIPNGESYHELYNRVKLGFEKLVRDNKNKTVLLVAHQGTLRIIATLLLGLKPEACWSFTFEAGCYSLFELHEDTAVVKRINC